MKKCRICSEFCDDNAQECIGCGNSDFVDMLGNPISNVVESPKEKPVVMDNTRYTEPGSGYGSSGSSYTFTTDTVSNKSSGNSYTFTDTVSNHSSGNSYTFTDTVSNQSSGNSYTFTDTVSNQSTGSDYTFTNEAADTGSGSSYTFTNEAADTGSGSSYTFTNEPVGESPQPAAYENAGQYSYGAGGNGYGASQDGFGNSYGNTFNTGAQMEHRRLSRIAFCRNCIPPEMKNELGAAYAVLILNMVLGFVLYYLFDEAAYLVDVGILLTVYLGLVLFKHTLFALLNLAYFGFAAVYNISQGVRAKGAIWAFIAGFAVLSVTRKVGRLWKEHKKTGMYVDYRKLNGGGKGSAVAGTIFVVVAVVALIGFGAKALKSHVLTPFEPGTIKDGVYTNNTMDLTIDASGEGWYIYEKEEVEELNEEVEEEIRERESGIYSNTETYDFVACELNNGLLQGVSYATGYSDVKDAMKEIQDDYIETFTNDYGFARVTMEGKTTLCGQEYDYFDILSKSDEEGYYDYERVFLKREGREICMVTWIIYYLELPVNEIAGNGNQVPASVAPYLGMLKECYK